MIKNYYQNFFIIIPIVYRVVSYYHSLWSTTSITSYYLYTSPIPAITATYNDLGLPSSLDAYSRLLQLLPWLSHKIYNKFSFIILKTKIWVNPQIYSPRYTVFLPSCGQTLQLCILLHKCKIYLEGRRNFASSSLSTSKLSSHSWRGIHRRCSYFRYTGFCLCFPLSDNVRLQAH